MKETLIHESSIAEFNPSKIKVFVFDVDDTITRGTQDFKNKAWEDIFFDKMMLLKEATALYVSTGKGDRYNMIAHIIGEPQKGCAENPKVQKFADKFEIVVQEKIRKSGIHPKDLQTILQIAKKFSSSLYLLSATPQRSMEGNISCLIEMYPELEGVFTRIIGTPLTAGKSGELKMIATENGVTTDEVLMVGDGGSDYNGATGAGTQFIGINPGGREDKWPNESFPKLGSVAELPKLLLI